MEKVIITGASVGIGKALAEFFLQKGYSVGLTARRLDLLEAIHKRYPDRAYTMEMDVSQPELAREKLKILIEEMGGLDILVLNAGVGEGKPDLKMELFTIDVNVKGFVALASVGLEHFTANKSGQLVGISSVASRRGTRSATVYAASKAFVSSYMEGLRQRFFKKKGITITDIRPGYIATDMTKDNKGMFWVVSAEKAAEDIFKAIKAKKQVAYIPGKWIIPAWLLRHVPAFVYNRL